MARRRRAPVRREPVNRLPADPSSRLLGSPFSFQLIGSRIVFAGYLQESQPRLGSDRPRRDVPALLGLRPERFDFILGHGAGTLLRRLGCHGCGPVSVLSHFET